MLPKETASVSRVKKNDWRGITKSKTPTLAWDLTLPGGEKQVTWAADVDVSAVSYDVEIYDKHQLVYSAKRVAGSQHTVELELDDCRTYWWSVRPAYTLDDGVRFGEWMRSNPDMANGNRGQAGSEAAAYIYDFASLEIKCGRR